MDIFVVLADSDDAVDTTQSAAGVPIAHVRSTPDRRLFDTVPGRGAREIVTLYGAVEADRLAVAIAAAFESRRTGSAPPDAIRQIGVWADRGAVGDVAWHDRATGTTITQDVSISAAAIAGTAGRLLVEHGHAIRQTAAGLTMADWPEGMRRAIHVSMADVAAAPVAADVHDALLASLREADGFEGAGGSYGDGYDSHDAIA